MSKQTTKPTLVETTRTEKPAKEKREKPGLEAHLAAKKALDAAIESTDNMDARRILNAYAKNLANKMRPWARISYGE